VQNAPFLEAYEKKEGKEGNVRQEWVMSCDKPFFQEARERFQEDKAEDGETAKPRAIYAIEMGGPYRTHVYYHMTESI